MFRIRAHDLLGEAAHRDTGQRQTNDRVRIQLVDPLVRVTYRPDDLVGNGRALDVSTNNGRFLLGHISILSGLEPGQRPNNSMDQDFAHTSFDLVYG